jgi:hypothetical protein
MRWWATRFRLILRNLIIDAIGCIGVQPDLSTQDRETTGIAEMSGADLKAMTRND